MSLLTDDGSYDLQEAALFRRIPASSHLDLRRSFDATFKHISTMLAVYRAIT